MREMMLKILLAVLHSAAAAPSCIAHIEATTDLRLSGEQHDAAVTTTTSCTHYYVLLPLDCGSEGVHAAARQLCSRVPLLISEAECEVQAYAILGRVARAEASELPPNALEAARLLAVDLTPRVGSSSADRRAQSWVVNPCCNGA